MLHTLFHICYVQLHETTTCLATENETNMETTIVLELDEPPDNVTSKDDTEEFRTLDMTNLTNSFELSDHSYGTIGNKPTPTVSAADTQKDDNPGKSSFLILLKGR